MWMFHGLNWCRSWSWVEKSQLPKAFSWKDCPFNFSVDLDTKFSLMENKERTGIVILFHQVLSLIHFTHLEPFQQCFLKLSVLNKTGKSEVRLETFENKSLICGCFLLIYYCKVFVDLTIITLHFDRTELSGLSLTLFY